MNKFLGFGHLLQCGGLDTTPPQKLCAAMGRELHILSWTAAFLQMSEWMETWGQEPLPCCPQVSNAHAWTHTWFVMLVWRLLVLPLVSRAQRGVSVQTNVHWLRQNVSLSWPLQQCLVSPVDGSRNPLRLPPQAGEAALSQDGKCSSVRVLKRIWLFYPSMSLLACSTFPGISPQ